MGNGSTWRRPLLALGFLAVTWVIPARADDDTPKPPTTHPATTHPAKNPGVAGSLAFLEQFKADVAGLKLPDDVQKKADGYFEAARKDLLDIGRSGDGDSKQKQHEVFEKLRTDISGLLNAEQKLAIEKKLRSAGTDAVIDKIKQQLPLLPISDEQKQKVTELLDDTKHRLEELRAEGGKDAREKAAAILLEMKQKLMKILAPDPAK